MASLHPFFGYYCLHFTRIFAINGMGRNAMKESLQSKQPQKQATSNPKLASTSQGMEINPEAAFQWLHELPAYPTNQVLRQNSIQRLHGIGNRNLRNLVMRIPEEGGNAASEEEQVIYQDNTRLFSGLHDDILDEEPLAILARGTRIHILDTSEPTVTFIEVMDGEYAGRRGYVSGLAQPHISAAEYQTLDEMLQYNGSHGWHISLPQSSLEAGSIGIQETGRGRERPTLGGSYPAESQMEPTAGSGADQARRQLLDYIRGQLASVSIPTESGQMEVFRGRGGRGGGYAYQARNYSTEGSQRHQAYMSQVSLEGIGLDASNPLTVAMWSEFRRIISHEGDTSAINAYDEQMVTIGAGFAATSNNAGAIYNRMPQETRQRLFEHGIRVNDDNSFSVIDLRRGVVEHGNNALRLMQVEPRMLGVLVQEAQSQREISQGEQRMSSAAWMVRAQFEQFMELNRGSEFLYAPPWDERTRRFAIRLRHWMGSLGWDIIRGANGNARALASRTYTHVHRVKPTWSEAYIRERIQTISQAAGCGNPW
jgi:hypothetical protein